MAARALWPDQMRAGSMSASTDSTASTDSRLIGGVFNVASLNDHLSAGPVWQWWRTSDQHFSAVTVEYPETAAERPSVPRLHHQIAADSDQRTVDGRVLDGAPQL
jgi:hypothetical protein